MYVTLNSKIGKLFHYQSYVYNLQKEGKKHAGTNAEIILPAVAYPEHL